MLFVLCHSSLLSHESCTTRHGHPTHAGCWSWALSALSATTTVHLRTCFISPKQSLFTFPSPQGPVKSSLCLYAAGRIISSILQRVWGVCVTEKAGTEFSGFHFSRTFSRTPHEALWHGWPLPLSMTLLRARCPVLWCEWTDHVGWPADLLLDVWAISACWVRRVALLGA